MARIQIKLTGRELPPRLPAVVTTSTRSSNARSDEFLPPGYLTPTSAFDVSAGARSAGAAAPDLQHGAAEDEIVVLELVDGSTFITSAARLQASLQQSRPELLGPNGEILVDRLGYEAAAGRSVFNAVGQLVSKVFTFVISGGASDAIGDGLKNVAGVGLTWAGTRALMNAIESKLLKEPGLYRWAGSTGTAGDFENEPPKALDAGAAAKAPLLVFVHGTGSSTLGSFGSCGRAATASGLRSRRATDSGSMPSSTRPSPKVRSRTRSRWSKRCPQGLTSISSRIPAAGSSSICCAWSTSRS
jgi:hypothetical protein